MDIAKILTELRTERASIDGAIAAIESLASAVRRRGRLAGTGVPKRRHPMSAAARNKIAAAQRRRWAAWRKKQKAA